VAEQTKAQVKHFVQEHRKQLPRVGTRKLYYLMQDELHDNNIKFGRDKVFDLLRENDLLIKPRRRYVQTTMSKHWMRKWPNIVKEKTVTQPDEVWVSDITYLKTDEGTCYLNMITDAYSRKIVGYALADSMETEQMIGALRMAVEHKGKTDIATIHHSDRGIQYCSKEYGRMTAQHNIRLSMTENSDPYENALAERMNRTMKEEFGLHATLLNFHQALRLVEESIALYNHKRPHLALAMQTPESIYNQQKSRPLSIVGTS